MSTLQNFRQLQLILLQTSCKKVAFLFVTKSLGNLCVVQISKEARGKGHRCLIKA